MNEQRRESEVDVALDPADAFAVFTEELDYWWLRGPINNWDSARIQAMRCEPGVGGRLLEIYDEAAGEMLELARITEWEPGARLSWRSSVDDVRVDVFFEPIPTGTRVRLTATVPPGGKDAGGGSFVRVAPHWLGRWVAVRTPGGHAVQEAGRLALAIHYAQPALAARWLRDTFGLEPTRELPANDDNGEGWIEFRIGDSPLMVFRRAAGAEARPALVHVPWVFVDDLDAHFAAAQRGGARIVSDIEQHGYRAYSAEDLEGNQWTFAQARPTQ